MLPERVLRGHAWYVIGFTTGIVTLLIAPIYSIFYHLYVGLGVLIVGLLLGAVFVSNGKRTWAEARVARARPVARPPDPLPAHCPARSPQGLPCSLPPGHPGQHKVG